MRQSPNALLRIVTGQGIIRRPDWLERMLTAFDRHPKTVDVARLTDRELSNIGLSRSQVEEAMRDRADWDAPGHWRAC